MTVRGSFRRVSDWAHPREKMQPTACLRVLACRLRCGGGMVGWGWCSQVCAPSELQFRALREGGGTRKAWSTVAESLIILYRVGTHQIRRRRRAARSSTSQGRAEALCARIKGVNRDVSGKSWFLTTVIFLPTMATRSGERARFVGPFRGCTGLRTAGCWLARRLHQPKASHHHGRRYLNFPCFRTMCGLEKLGLLLDQNWLERNLSALLLRTLVVGRRHNPSRSRLLSILWSKEVWWTILILVGAIACRVAWLLVAIWIPVGLRSGLSPRCDPLTLVPSCYHKRDWHLISLWQTCCVTIVSSVARTVR